MTPHPVDPLPPDAALQQAALALQEGDSTRAAAILVAILKSTPGHADAMHLLGIARYRQGLFREASECISQALSVMPEVPELWFNLGNALRKAGDREGAAAAFLAALARDSGLSPAREALADLARETGRHAEAAEYFHSLANAEPERADWWAAAGEMHLAAGRRDLAVDALQNALRLDAGQSGWWNNLGVALSQCGLLTAGRSAFEHACAIDPGQARYLGNYANALRDAGRVDDAMRYFDRLVEQRPGDPLIRSNALLSSLYSSRRSPVELAEAHFRFDREVVGVASGSAAARPLRRSSGRIRIAYLSPDFRAHPVASFMAGILAHHDRGAFEIFLYSCGPHEADLWTGRIRSFGDHWRDLSRLADSEMLDVAKADGIEVLVDLAGHTAFNRATALARRLAPVQMAFLGYPFSTGISAVDFRLTDAVADPPGHGDLSSERLIRLSRSYYAFTPPQGAPDVSALPMARNGFPTFGVVSNLSKVSEHSLDLWAALLTSLPEARLVWRAKAFADPSVAASMRDLLSARGLGAGNIDLRGWDTVDGRWAIFSEIDIAMDTFPYNQATSTCEALWMGIPTVTYAGDRHQARMGASIMSAAGLPEFVAASASEWVALGQAMAGRRAWLAEWRKSARRLLQQSELLDVAGLTLELEDAFRCAARPPGSAPDAEQPSAAG